MCFKKFFCRNNVNSKGHESQSSKQDFVFVFQNIPSSLEEFQALPESAMDNPYKTGALTVLAFCMYKEHKDEALACLDFLQKQPLTHYQKQFIDDRLRGKQYKPFSYLKGATPENGYTPSMPLTVIFESRPSYKDDEGYFTLFIQSSGTDSLREIRIKKQDDGLFVLWDQFLLADVRSPK